MELLYVLLVLLVVTRAFGEVAERLRQPVLAGELVAGIVVGLVAARFSGTFPILAGLSDDKVFRAVTDLGIFVLMLQAGVELRPRDLVGASRNAIGVAMGGMLLPLALGLGLGWLFLPASAARPAQALFLGVALAITAVPVSVKVLMDFGKLDTRIGRTVVSAAIIDDVLSLVLLAVLTALLRNAMPGGAGFLLLAAKITAFFAVTIALGRFALPRIGSFVGRSRLEEFEFSLLLIVALAFAFLAERLGMHFILGAFVAGLFFGRETIDRKVYRKVRERIGALSTGFLAPVFFASIGLHMELSALAEIPVFVLLLVLAASVGKVLGAFLPARIAGMPREEALAVGVAMNARGAVELVIAGVALRAGLFATPDPPPPIVAHLFAAVVFMAVVTTVATPFVLNRLLSPAERDRG